MPTSAPIAFPLDVIARNLQDAPRLDGSTGFSAEDIAAIKSHVVDESHPLEGEDGGVVQAPFEPNADMAEPGCGCVPATTNRKT